MDGKGWRGGVDCPIRFNLNFHLPDGYQGDIMMVLHRVYIVYDRDRHSGQLTHGLSAAEVAPTTTTQLLLH